MPARDVNAEWSRLEALLTDTKPGDPVSIDALGAASGLSITIVSRIMSELERVELFIRLDDNVYVRRSLWSSTGADG
jgi:hypothetical protein